MSNRLTDEQITDEMWYSLGDAEVYILPSSESANHLTHIAERVADAQRKASDEEWVNRLDKFGYGHVINDIALYSE